MDFRLPADTLTLQEMLRRFIEKDARPLEMKYFSSRCLEPAEHRRLRTAVEQLGLWGVTVPEAHGGFGLDMITTCVIEEELGKTFLPIELGEVSPLLYSCKGDQVARYLRPALAGNRRALIAAREPARLQPRDWTTSARPQAEGFALNGEKCLAVMPDPQDFLVVFAGAPAGLTAFLLDIDAEGVRISPGDPVLLQLESCAVAGEQILGEIGAALTLGGEHAPGIWVRSGARTVGLVGRMLEMAAEYAREWESLGAPLAIRPAIWRILADLRTQTESVRWLVYHAAWLSDEGEPLAVAAAQVRIATADLLSRAADLGAMVYGGPGPGGQIHPNGARRGQGSLAAYLAALDGARLAVVADWIRDEHQPHPAH